MYPDWLSGPVPNPSRPITVTGELRANQRVEALRELRVLTEQLLDLPERLRQVGLAQRQSQQLQDAIEAFTELATLAWQGLAEDRFDEVIAQPIYRQRAVAATKRVNRLQQVASDPDGTPAKALTIPVKVVTATKPTTAVPFFWHARVRRSREGLEQMRAALTLGELTLPEASAVSGAIEALRGAAGYGGMHPLMLSALRAVTLIALVAGGLVTVLLIAASASAFTLHQMTLGATFAVGAVALAFVYGATTLMLASNRPALVDYIGLVRWRLYARERSVGLGLLTGWNWFASLVACLGSLGALGVAGWLIAKATAQGHTFAGAADFAQVLQIFSGPTMLILVGAASVLLALPTLVALPATLIYQFMVAGEMGASNNWTPVARRSLLRPALRLLAWHLILVAPLALGIAQLSPMTQQTLYAMHGVTLTGRSVIFAGLVLFLYLLLVGLPLRNGVARWRYLRLVEARQRLEIVADKIRQMAPVPDAIEDLGPIGRELDWVNYLRGQEQDLRRVRRAVAGFGERVLALLIVLVVALLADNGITWVARIWTGH